MSWLKKGPEIKLSELKVPDFLYDLYYDLKDRHLLPLVAILLVAMVAMPIVLETSKHSDDEEPVVPPAATASSASGGDEAIIVSRSTPGLRDLRRRFSHARALDPFAKKVVEAKAAEASAEATSSEVEVPTEATVIGAATSSPPSAEISTPREITVPTTPGGAESSAGGPTRTRYASNSIDVRIVSVPPTPSAGSDRKKAKQKPKAQVRRDLPELTMLPARATPAVTFMGTSRDDKKALLLVSSDVVSIFGEATCVIGSQTCQLLALEPDLPETFVYGPQERTYRIELLKISRTLTVKPRRATLGTTRHGKHGQAGKSEEEASPTEPAGRGEAAESPAG